MVFVRDALLSFPQLIFWSYESKQFQLKKCESHDPLFLAFPKIPFKSIYFVLRWQELPNSAPEHFCH